jgi:hypothetical protein
LAGVVNRHLGKVYFIQTATTTRHIPIRLTSIDSGGHHERRTFPIVSEFETEEQAASYDRWFRAKVQASLMIHAQGSRTIK